MADGVGYTPGSGSIIATDDVGGFQFQRVKPVWGGDGIVNDASPSAPFPVALGTTQRYFANIYETVPAGSTGVSLGTGTGGLGDYIAGVLIVPASTSPGGVTLIDNATSITIFSGGASSLSNLVPFYVPLGMVSASGGWKLSTGSNVSAIGIGAFS